MMPEMDGLQLCRQVRERENAGYVYIILLAAKDSQENIIKGLESGAELLARINTGTRVIKLERSLKKAYGEIKALSITDSLTGCYNRRYLEEKLSKEIKRARRYQRKLSLAMCDIDHFKKVNDTYGHPVGDMVLKEVVGRLRTSIRADIDWIARYGGEEFIIVFPETSLENTFTKADSLRRMISEKKVAVAGWDQVFVTVSFGVSSIEKMSDGGDVSGDEMIKNADVCLYKAKSSGRNRVVKE